MPPKGYILVGATMTPEWSDKVAKICSFSKESKADFFKRVISNELAIIEGRTEDIKSIQQSILDKKIDLLISKSDLIIAKSLDHTEKIERNYGAISFVLKMVFRSMYYISRLLYHIGGFREEDINVISDKASDLTKKSFSNYLEKVSKGNAESILDYLNNS